MEAQKLIIAEQKQKIDNILDSSSHVFTDTYIWKINQFSKKMDQAEHDCNRDQPLVKSFYTSRGHKLQISLYLNGYEESWDEDVSIFFNTAVGIFDDVVKWPVKAVIKYCILKNGNEYKDLSFDTSTSGTARCFQNPSFKTPGGFGTPTYTYHGSLNAFLLNNSLSLKIQVDYR